MLALTRSAARLRLRVGVRLALVQAVIVVLAFALAGYLAQASLGQLSQSSIHAQIRGEAKSLEDEFAKKGARHLPFTVAKRSRLWRGFDYRLESPAGVLLAGRLPSLGGRLGLGDVTADLPDGRRHYFVTFTTLMPDGSRLTVGQDKAVEAGELAAIRRTLLVCGALGVTFCVAASHLFSRRTWRRIAAMGKAARAVSLGDLDVRIPSCGGAPRDDIDELAEAFNAMLERIGVLVAQVSQVSTDIAHDLRTPLSRIGHKLEKLKTKAKGDREVARSVAELETDLHEILRTFDALLQLSKIEVGGGPNFGIVDLDDLVARVVEAYRPDIEDSGRRLEVNIEKASVRGDSDLLTQALSNILENALRHTAKTACIVVCLQRSSEGATLFVEDNGRGIPAEQLQNVVKPFVRLEQSRNTAGAGLGLSIVAAVAERHAAGLFLEDASPGLRVKMLFPVLASHLRAEGRDCHIEKRAQRRDGAELSLAGLR